MDGSLALLSVTAISIGFLHTLLGPDHYLPFIVLGEAKKWTLRKTMVITFLCWAWNCIPFLVQQRKP